MSIEKNTKNTLQHEESGFTTNINATLQNINDDAALGVYCYLSSMPAGWNICKIQLQKHFNRGKAHMNRVFAYLKKINAIEVRMVRDDRGQVKGWETILKRKITPLIQNTENRYSGKKIPVDNSLNIHSSRIPVSQILDKPESGLSDTINKTLLKKEEVTKKTRTKQEPVFLCSQDVQNHLVNLLLSKDVTLSLDEISQIMFYVDGSLHYPTVSKLINIALKMMREKKWNIPQGWKGVTSQAIAKKEAEYLRNKAIQQDDDGKMFRSLCNEAITRGVISPVATSALSGMLNTLRGGNA